MNSYYFFISSSRYDRLSPARFQRIVSVRLIREALVEITVRLSDAIERSFSGLFLWQG